MFLLWCKKLSLKFYDSNKSLADFVIGRRSLTPIAFQSWDRSQRHYLNIVYRNTWLGNQKLLIVDLIVNIILDYLKKTVHNVFTITTNIQGGAL